MKKPKVLLLNPPFRRRIGNIWRYVSGVLPPLGIGYIAGMLEKNGVDIDIVDAPAEGVELLELPRRLGETKYDYIGITATTAMFPNAIASAKLLKWLYPSAKIILGGVHSTARPYEALAEPAVDIVVAGEGEITFSELVNGRPPQDILGVFFKNNGEACSTGTRPLIEDLDSLPYPAYHKLPMKLYRPAVGGYHRLPAVHMLTSRGCPHHCTYCYHIFGRGVRFRSPENVLEELKFMLDKYDVREVYFYDDTFNLKRDRVIKICEGILKLNRKIGWSCLARVDGMDKELLTLMKKSGCHAITYGVETSEPEILKNIRKKISLEEAERVIRYTVEAGIVCRVGFMLGNPGETMETMKKTIRYAIKCGTHGAMFNIVTPYPGTEMFEWGIKNGYIKNFNWEQYDFSTPILEVPGLTAKEIKKMQDYGHRKFFLRPAFFWTVLTHVHTWDGFKGACIGALSVIGALEAHDRLMNFLKGRKDSQN